MNIQDQKKEKQQRLLKIDRYIKRLDKSIENYERMLNQLRNPQTSTEKNALIKALEFFRFSSQSESTR